MATPRPRVTRPRIKRKTISKDARRAGIRRVIKTTWWNVVGFLLVNAVAIAAAFFLGLHFGVEIATLLSLVVGAIAQGVQKSISWVNTGFDPNAQNQLTMPNVLAGRQ